MYILNSIYKMHLLVYVALCLFSIHAVLAMWKNQPHTHTITVAFAAFGSLHSFMILHTYTFSKTGRIDIIFDTELVQLCTIPVILFVSMCTDRLHHLWFKDELPITSTSKTFLIGLLFSSSLFIFACMQIEKQLPFSIYIIIAFVTLIFDSFLVSRVFCLHSHQNLTR